MQCDSEQLLPVFGGRPSSSLPLAKLSQLLEVCVRDDVVGLNADLERVGVGHSQMDVALLDVDAGGGADAADLAVDLALRRLIT